MSAQVDVVRVRFAHPMRDQLMIVEEPGLKNGDAVIVHVERGEELARVIGTPELRDRSAVPQETRTVVRKATEQDIEKAGRMQQRAQEAMDTCRECITQQKLAMTLVDAEYAFDGTKLTFYFTSETRVDFRKLVRDLAHIFRTRIELRQIGVRDEAKRMGGIGPCGQTICCATFLRDFAPVSIKMAKDQGLNLSPVKISGLCGRLMCCLNYEEEYYRTRRKEFPRLGQRFLVHGSPHHVISVNMLTDSLWLEGAEKKIIKLALEEFHQLAKPLRPGEQHDSRDSEGGEHRGGRDDRRGGRGGRDDRRGGGRTSERRGGRPAPAPSSAPDSADLPDVSHLEKG